jgi:hypothetical protein
MGSSNGTPHSRQAIGIVLVQPLMPGLGHAGCHGRPYKAAPYRTCESICKYFTLLTPERALDLLQLGYAQKVRAFEEPVSGEAALRECAV